MFSETFINKMKIWQCFKKFLIPKIHIGDHPLPNYEAKDLIEEGGDIVSQEDEPSTRNNQVCVPTIAVNNIKFFAYHDDQDRGSRSDNSLKDQEPGDDLEEFEQKETKVDNLLNMNV